MRHTAREGSGYFSGILCGSPNTNYIRIFVRNLADCRQDIGMSFLQDLLRVFRQTNKPPGREVEMVRSQQAMENE
jgi:hypothetical protein